MSGEKQPIVDNPSFQQQPMDPAAPAYQVPYPAYQQGYQQPPAYQPPMQGGFQPQQPMQDGYQPQQQPPNGAVYYQQPPPGYQGPYPPQAVAMPVGAPMGTTTTTVYVQQLEPAVIVPGPLYLRDRPVAIVCPYCGARGMTQIDYEPGACTWLSVGGCVLCGLWLGCCLIPLCVDSLKDVVHYCPNCHHHVGKFNRL